MKPGSLLIRADANVSIGTGHVMRCLALAEAWQDAGGTASFLSAEQPDGLQSRIAGNGISHSHLDAVPGSSADAAATVAQARQLDVSWMVVDGDRFRGDFLDQVHRAGIRAVLIDDFADREAVPADLIVNPNPGTDPEDYRARGADGQVLAGTKYVLLRREFRLARQERTDSTGNRVLVTLGGSDPEELTPRIVTALVSCTDLQITVVAGAGNSSVNALQKLGTSNVLVIVDSQNMAELMAESDLAVIAAGGTLWELLSMRCAVLSYARNTVQKRVVQSLAKDGVVVDMGETVDFSAASLVSEVRRLVELRTLREQMAARGKKLVDGLGAARVVEAMLHLGAH